MKPNWPTKKLGKVAEIIIGQSPPSSTYNERGEGLPFFQGKAEFGEIYPTPVKYCPKPTRIAETGDILISVRAPVGNINLAKDKSLENFPRRRSIKNNSSPKNQNLKNFLILFCTKA